jgi:hypothetical protein
MTALDARRRIGTPDEARLHEEILRAVRLTVDTYCARRGAEERGAKGFEFKKLVLKDEIALSLGCSRRQVDLFGESVPITLAKAVKLCLATGNRRLLELFARELLCALVPLRPPELAGLGDANAEIFRGIKESTEFTEAALCLGKPGLGKLQAVSPADVARIRKEGWESIEQTLREITLAEQQCFGEIRTPALARANQRQG